METTTVTAFEMALAAAGVTATTLRSDEKQSLDDQGWLVWRGLIDPKWLEQMRAAFEVIAASERADSQQKETGTRHPRDLLNRDRVFIEVCVQPQILAAIHHVLRRPFRLTQCSGRDPLPGFGQQGLHADWLPRAAQEPYSVVTTIWMLDDFTSDNGATRLVPGTHRLVGSLPKAMVAPASHHPDEMLIEAPAGSVLLFNGHLWHSGTGNKSQRSRRALQCVFHASEAVPPFAQPLHDNPAELSLAARYFLGSSVLA